ncbi:MAG: hypothetical protein RTV31_15680 [Candidatus Thorarchaeota archaeon]
MVSKYVNCPVCGERTSLEIDSSIVENAKRFPVTTKIEHQDHYFYINLDSKGSITDILSPELVE